MTKTITKTERLEQILMLLTSNPFGLKKADLARRLNVSRATIGRDIDTLTNQYPIWVDEKNLLHLDRSSILNQILLNSHEIQAIHLACRLLARKVRFPYRSAASALRKLAAALTKYNNNISKSIDLTAHVFDYADSTNTHNYENYLHTLTQAMAERRAVHITHYSKRTQTTKTYTIHPYHIEPYAEGNSIHILGYNPEKKAIINLKIERVTNITLTDHTYPAPDHFDADSYFKTAWGIWQKDTPPENVELIFTPAVAPRVQATQWNKSEKTAPLPDGSLIWSCPISEPQEMVPWIRGWGPDVTVRKPDWLKYKIAEDTAKTLRRYDNTKLPQNTGLIKKMEKRPRK